MQMTIKEYAFATREEMGDEYETWCLNNGLEVTEEGYGLLFCTDENNNRWTQLGSTQYTRMLVDAHKQGVVAGLDLPQGVYLKKRPGWPDEW